MGAIDAALARLNKLPAWARFASLAAIGIFVLAAVESLEAGGAGRLTSGPASSAMLRWSVPILLAGLGGLFSERAGVVNIGLEGMMLMGAYFSVWGADKTGQWTLGVLIGLLEWRFFRIEQATALSRRGGSRDSRELDSKT